MEDPNDGLLTVRKKDTPLCERNLVSLTLGTYSYWIPLYWYTFNIIENIGYESVVFHDEDDVR